MFDSASRLQALLRQRGISLYRFSVISNLSCSTLKDAGRRRRQLSLDSIELACQALGITLSEFFAEPTDTEGPSAGI